MTSQKHWIARELSKSEADCQQKFVCALQVNAIVTSVKPQRLSRKFNRLMNDTVIGAKTVWPQSCIPKIIT